jgi:hypothetical protein
MHLLRKQKPLQSGSVKKKKRRKANKNSKADWERGSGYGRENGKNVGCGECLH